MGRTIFEHDRNHLKMNLMDLNILTSMKFTQKNFDGFDPYNHHGFHSKTYYMVLTTFDHYGLHLKMNLMVLTHIAIMDFTRE